MTASRPSKPRAPAARINARLPPETERKLAYLQRATSRTTTEVLLTSIDRYYEELRGAVSAATILERTGFVGCADGPDDLSTTYKQTLSGLLAKKHGT